MRSAYAEQMTNLLTWDGTSTIDSITVHPQQTQAKWQSADDEATTTIAGGVDGAEVEVTAKTKGTDWTVSVNTTDLTVEIN